MSVQSQIDRIEQNIENTYAVLAGMGADMPDKQNSDNLPETAMSAKEKMPHSNIVDYIKTEVMEVAEKVRNVMTDDSIVYLAMSDTHYPGDKAGAWNREQNNEGSLHTAMAAKALSYVLPLDFVAHLGDFGCGTSSTTPDDLKAQTRKFMSLFEEAKGNVPCFIAIGNHDTNIDYHKAQTDGAVHTMPGNWLYENFTAHSASDNTVFGGAETGGYCYRDFPDKKLRVFLLNSSEQLVTSQTDKGASTTQQLWVANALKNLGSKADAAEWGFIVLCHYPLDYADARPITNVFKAYVEGESITIDETTVNFNGSNGAKFIVQHHGHVHNFKYARLNGYESWNTMTEYNAWRVAIPNVQYDRENYYTDPIYGVYFCEDNSYPKTPDTAEETSFVVNVYNRSENILHSFCYGAGYDRTISFESVKYYSIFTTLTDASVDSSATTIKEGDPYTGTIRTADGFNIKSVVITMGGVDITSSVYANGVITIPNVAGDVRITVVAVGNMIRLSTEVDGVTIYNNGKGYKAGFRLSTSDGGDRTKDGMYVSGYIPITKTDTLRLVNVGNKAVNYENSRLIFFTSLGSVNDNIDLTTLTPEADGSIVITGDKWYQYDTYCRLSCSYIGDDSAVYKE